MEALFLAFEKKMEVIEAQVKEREEAKAAKAAKRDKSKSKSKRKQQDVSSSSSAEGSGTEETASEDDKVIRTPEGKEATCSCFFASIQRKYPWWRALVQGCNHGGRAQNADTAHVRAQAEWQGTRGPTGH